MNAAWKVTWDTDAKINIWLNYITGATALEAPSKAWKCDHEKDRWITKVYLYYTLYTIAVGRLILLMLINTCSYLELNALCVSCNTESMRMCYVQASWYVCICASVVLWTRYRNTRYVLVLTCIILQQHHLL
jgi:hypothetical protein